MVLFHPQYKYCLPVLCHYLNNLKLLPHLSWRWFSSTTVLIVWAPYYGQMDLILVNNLSSNFAQICHTFKVLVYLYFQLYSFNSFNCCWIMLYLVEVNYSTPLFTFNLNQQLCQWLKSNRKISATADTYIMWTKGQMLTHQVLLQYGQFPN